MLTLSAIAADANPNWVNLEFRPLAEIGPRATQVKGPKDELAIEIVSTEATLTTTELVVCDNPDIGSHEYYVRGRVKYEGVDGTGYLELWNDFGEKGKHFSRSLAESGPMGKLSGTSDWREFELPFYAEPGMKPTRLTLNLVLPGKGKVTISGPLKVNRLVSSNTTPLASTGGKFAFRTIAEIGTQAKEVKGPSGETAIELTGLEDERTTTEVATCDEPKISSHQYIVKGRVKYEGVVGDGYLEMWNGFGKNGKYFSRSLAESGPMGKLSGTSDWREFALPFYSEPGLLPSRLTLNVVLPGTGTVTIAGPLSVEPVDSADTKTSANTGGKFEFRSIAEIGPHGKEVSGPSGEPAIELVSAEPSKSTTEVATCDDPVISSPSYIVKGRVKYDMVEGDGYLEMWNDFGEKGRFFSRSLAEWGPMGKLSGTSDWREFALPFYSESGWKPKRLTLNVVLPGRGKVTIAGPLRIEANSSMGFQSHGWISALLGSFFGIIGGVLPLIAFLSKSKKVAAVSVYTVVALGFVSLIAGLVALFSGQPYDVYYPLLLCGFIVVLAVGLNSRNIIQNANRRIEEAELRKMNAVDAI